MQIQYELTDQKVTKWKHRSLILSISFVVTEYSPEEGFSLGKQINKNIKNGSRIDFSQLLPIVPSLNVRMNVCRCFFTKESTQNSQKITQFYG